MIQPPKFAEKLLTWYSDSATTEDLLGDLDETFYNTLETKGPWKARLNYWINTLALIFSYALKKRKREASYSVHYLSSSKSIWLSYCKISLRNLTKQKVFTLLNVVGFGMGMSVAVLFLVMYIELGRFDAHHASASSTYRLTSILEEQGDIKRYASSPVALADAIVNRATGLKKSVRINSAFTPRVNRKGQFIETHGYFTEPSFFELFDFKFIEGSAHELNAPGTVVITKELAIKLFGDQKVLHEVIRTENWGLLTVVGVLDKFPKRTHFDFELVTGFPTSGSSDLAGHSSSWLDFKNNYLYLEIDPLEKQNLSSQISGLAMEGGVTFQEDGKQATFELQSILDINLGSSYKNDIGYPIAWSDITLFFLISMLILLPACFNYSNMSIARALDRSKEIGIRKVVGSQRRQIVEQFIVETVMICGISVVLAAYIFTLIRSEFLSMLTIGHALTLEMSPLVILTFIGFAVTTGVLTGLTPAFYLAKISPINALKNTFSPKNLSISGMRKGLLVIQFISTLVLVTGIGVFIKQYQHTLTYNFGFHKDDILVFPLYDQDPEVIRTSFLSNPDVEEISFSSSLPGTRNRRTISMRFDQMQDSMLVREVFTDQHFMSHMNLKLKWGKPLDNKDYQIERVLVNQRFMETIRAIRDDHADSVLVDLSNGRRFLIVGVLENYNHEPLDQKIEPLIMRSDVSKATHALVSLSTDDLIPSITSLENTWDELYPDIRFDASFLEHEIEASHGYFKAYLNIFGFLAAMAGTVACLGLLGMVIYTTENRVKEITIRKVLGADKSRLFHHLSGMYLRLWIIAVFIAVPLTYLVFNFVVVDYFNKFSNGVGFIEMVASILFTLVLLGSAIILQVNKIASINPVDNLRND